MKTFLYLIGLSLGLSMTTNADTWLLPKEKKYCSENKKFCLKVQPKKLTSQLSYFQDKVDGEENAGGDKNVRENYCTGKFFADGKKIWKIKLDNEVSPVNVIVSNSGDYVVTFDNWHGTGYGDNVVVIYDASNGNLVRKLGLMDFLTENDFDELPRSTSSIKWSGEHHLDYEKKQLVLRVVGGRTGYFDVHVDLGTGDVLNEKVDRIPSLQFLLFAKVNDSKFGDQTSNLEIANCPNETTLTHVSRQEFIERVEFQEIPKYPPAARAVRASGFLLVNVLVASTGEVECAEVKFGHPLLRTAVLNAVKKWKFTKFTTKYFGQLVFEGRYTLTLNGKPVD